VVQDSEYFLSLQLLADPAQLAQVLERLVQRQLVRRYFGNAILGAVDLIDALLDGFFDKISSAVWPHKIPLRTAPSTKLRISSRTEMGSAFFHQIRIEVENVRTIRDACLGDYTWVISRRDSYGGDRNEKDGKYRDAEMGAGDAVASSSLPGDR
jgi:hypothetical protein